MHFRSESECGSVFGSCLEIKSHVNQGAHGLIRGRTQSYGVTRAGLSRGHDTGRVHSQFLALSGRKGCSS